LLHEYWVEYAPESNDLDALPILHVLDLEVMGEEVIQKIELLKEVTYREYLVVVMEKLKEIIVVDDEVVETTHEAD
jgi:hypothetical protein